MIDQSDLRIHVLLLAEGPSGTVRKAYDYDGKVEVIAAQEVDSGDLSKRYDLVLTDRKPCDLKDWINSDSGAIGVILKTQNDVNDHDGYANLFQYVKYKTAHDYSQNLDRIVSSEVVKWLALRYAKSSLIVSSRHTRKEFLKRSFGELGWLLIPFLLILFYYCLRYVLSILGYSIALLPYFVDYRPDASTNVFADLQLVGLLYALCNLVAYYMSTVRVFERVPSETFSGSIGHGAFHWIVRLIAPLLFFVTGMVIAKELFILRKGQEVSQKFGIVDVEDILNVLLPSLNQSYVIHYFIAMDFLILAMAFNAAAASKRLSFLVPDTKGACDWRAQILLEYGKKAGTSLLLTIVALGFVYVVLAQLMPDQMGKMAVQIIVLQLIYLWQNVQIIGDNFLRE